jgi:hypothetical protein
LPHRSGAFNKQRQGARARGKIPVTSAILGFARFILWDFSFKWV